MAVAAAGGVEAKVTTASETWLKLGLVLSEAGVELLLEGTAEEVAVVDAAAAVLVFVSSCLIR